MSTFESVFCDHAAMRDHCDGGCEHYECPCGIYWDEAEGGGPHWDPYEELNHDHDLGSDVSDVRERQY